MIKRFIHFLRSNTAPTIHGRIDQLTPEHISGWAQQFGSSLPVAITVFLNNHPVAHGLADKYRKDLEANGIGDGRHAFDIPLRLNEKDLWNQSISVRETATGEIIAVLRYPVTDTVDENKRLRDACFVLKSLHMRDLPLFRWESPGIAHQAIVDWMAKQYREAGGSRLCFAIQGASAVGKTTLAYQIRQKLIDDAHIATWLVRRDLFIIKESDRRTFDRKSTRMMQRQLQDWQIKNEKLERLLGCPAHLPQTLAGDGIVLLDDLRDMPDLPINGSIYLFYDIGELARREERRNQKAWPWWEHLRRRCSKFLFQRKLLRRAMHSTVPCLLVCWNPHGKSTAQTLNV